MGSSFSMIRSAFPGYAEATSDAELRRCAHRGLCLPQCPTFQVTQDACHLAHGQGIRAQPRQLLRAIPGLELVEMAEADRCCGSAGVYNVLQPDMAEELGQDKARRIAETGAEVVVSANPGCILQIRSALVIAGVRARVVHLADLLAEAL